jgi:hypothetical protein
MRDGALFVVLSQTGATSVINLFAKHCRERYSAIERISSRRELRG